MRRVGGKACKIREDKPRIQDIQFTSSNLNNHKQPTPIVYPKGI